MRVLRLFPLVLIAVSARADLFTSADSGLSSCSGFGGPLSAVGTSHAVIDIPSCGSGSLLATNIHAEAFAATGYLRSIVGYTGDAMGKGVSAIGSFDISIGDTTSTAQDLTFLITGKAFVDLTESSITGTLSLTLDGTEFDDSIVSYTQPCCGGGKGFTFNNLANFHITGLPAGIATVKLSVDGQVLEGIVSADITATQVPEPSAIVLFFSCVIAAGAPRIFRAAQDALRP